MTQYSMIDRFAGKSFNYQFRIRREKDMIRERYTGEQIIGKLLEHADIMTIQFYAHLRSDDLRNAVERLDQGRFLSP